MRTYVNWKLAVSMLVASCLFITQLETRALAQAQENTPPVPVAANQNPSPQETVPQSTPDQTKPKSGHRRLKWLLIGVAVVGGIAAAVLIKNKSKAEPVVTVGGPTVGNPQ